MVPHSAVGKGGRGRKATLGKDEHQVVCAPLIEPIPRQIGNPPSPLIEENVEPPSRKALIDSSQTMLAMRVPKFDYSAVPEVGATSGLSRRGKCCGILVHLQSFYFILGPVWPVDIILACFPANLDHLKHLDLTVG